MIDALNANILGVGIIITMIISFGYYVHKQNVANAASRAAAEEATARSNALWAQAAVNAASPNYDAALTAASQYDSSVITTNSSGIIVAASSWSNDYRNPKSSSYDATKATTWLATQAAAQQTSDQ